MKISGNSIQERWSDVQASDVFHIHDVFAMAIGKPRQQIMGDSHENQTFDTLAERKEKLFDADETENRSIDSEREITSSRTVAKEDIQRANREFFLGENYI